MSKQKRSLKAVPKQADAPPEWHEEDWLPASLSDAENQAYLLMESVRALEDLRNHELGVDDEQCELLLALLADDLTKRSHRLWTMLKDLKQRDEPTVPVTSTVAA